MADSETKPMWPKGQDATPAPCDVDAMACVLEGRHGRFAAEVAEFFSSYHEQGGDAGRAWAWAGVAQTIRRRERVRTNGSLTRA